MRFSLYLDDYETEKVFSYLRWLMVGFAVVLFYVPTISQALGLDKDSFHILLILGTLYMAITQVALYRVDPQHRYFKLMLKTGILFDYIALMWLLALTGGVVSPLFPVSYLLVMHAAIYWKTKGAFLSSFFVTIGYSGLVFFQDAMTIAMWTIFGLNFLFTWIVGVFGALIILRERKHFTQNRLLHELVVTDYLTGLYNHRCFQEQLNTIMHQNEPFVLVLGDIDYFKKFNDQHGHLVGDEVLKALGKILDNTARNHHGQAFRYGGEEFAFLFPKYDEEHLIKIFNELYSDLNGCSFTKKHLRVTMSFGAASSNGVRSRDQIIAKTDECLYDAKNRGKNQVVFDWGTVYVNSAIRSKEVVCN